MVLFIRNKADPSVFGKYSEEEPVKYDRIDERSFSDELTAFRRDLHKYPENAWNEYATTVKIIKKLEALGIPYWFGPRLHTTGERMNLPTPEFAKECMEQAIKETGEEELITQMEGGYTGVVAFINGDLPGPTIAIRCDIDCVDVDEDTSMDHRPTREGFASTHPHRAHSCGHDSHAAIGLGTVKILNAYKDKLKGRVILIFQPAEEGNRGAISMVGSGMFKDLHVDYMFVGHGGYQGMPVGQLFASSKNFAIGYKMNLKFKGKASHAGNNPQNGKNALMAACTAVLGLYGISRTSAGWSRVNVGFMQAGVGRNVIPENALLWAEVRGETEEIRDYMWDRAMQICEGAARMYDCEFSYDIKGRTRSINCDPALVSLIKEVAEKAEGVTKVYDCSDKKGGGDDVTHIMYEIQQLGGLVDHIAFGSSATAPLHSGQFDIDESVMPLMAKLYCDIVFELGERHGSLK